ncbi:MAG TPA: hypothetical protein EYP57_05835 [Thermodesulfobacteriaceae bacterium]|nr:hypothetical protein [Thermodesulfobacteriaceae bacterium]
MDGLKKSVGAALIVGVHHEELPFGRAAVLALGETGSIPDLKVIEIAQGLARPQSFRNRKFFYNTYHNELYLQIHRQLKKKYGLVMDLHVGHIEEGLAAEIYTRNRRLLSAIDRVNSDSSRLDLYFIAGRNEYTENTEELNICHTIIPECVWRSDSYVYAGIEIFVESRDGFSGFRKDEIDFAVEIIRLVWKGFNSIQRQTEKNRQPVIGAGKTGSKTEPG